ncbi:MAG: cohesin domain-containing protein [Desulfuromonadales bacterium]
MARINKLKFAGGVGLLLLVFLLGGCAAYLQSEHAKSAFEEAEQFAAEDKFDQAVAKYIEAADLEPSSKIYKLKVISSRTRAAAYHVKQARLLSKEGKLTEAVAEYRRALDFDPSIEIAGQEQEALLNQINAQSLAEEAASFYSKKQIALAQRAIEKALQLDPRNARAMAIEDLIERDQRTVAMDGVELDVTSTQPITLSFKEADIKEVFGILSKLSGINFIFDEDIRNQSISVLLEKASFAQAMELIMQMNGLDKKVLNSKTIIIYPQSRDKAKQYEDQIIQTFYLSYIDAKKAVNLLRTMLQLRKIYVHEERNALVIRDSPQVIHLAEQILQAADRENSEVLFALEIVSVADTDDLNFGPELSRYGVSVGFSNPGSSTILDDTIPISGSNENLATSLSDLRTFYTVPTAAFEFKKTLSTSEVLASPKIRVRNREKAKVHIGTREPVITSTTTDTSTTANVQYVDVGVKVDIEPVIQLDNTVETKVTLEVSRVISRDTVANTSALTIQTTNAQTVLTIQDGVQTILGGLFEQDTSKGKTTIPWVGEIPLLGDLISKLENRDIKREILLSITPYVIKQVDVPGIDVATIWSGGEDNLKVGPNFAAFSQPMISDVEATKLEVTPAAKQSEQEISVINQGFVEVEPGKPELLVPVDTTGQGQPAGMAPTPDNVQPQDTPTVAPTDGGQAADGAVPAEVMSQPAAVAPPITMDMSPQRTASLTFLAPSQVAKGEVFTATVHIGDAEKLYSAPLFVGYDPAALELVSIDEGEFLKQGGQTTVFSSAPNRKTGQVIVGYKQGSGGQGATGSGELFSLTFKAIAEGATSLDMNRVNFRNPQGDRLQVAPETATIVVR